MDSWWKVLAFALLTIPKILPHDVSCVEECVCIGRFLMACNEQALSEPPVGNWPGISELELVGNDIHKLQWYSLTGFPNVEKLRLDGNKLTELDLRVFAATPRLSHLFAYSNRIHTVTPLSEALPRGPKAVYLAHNALEYLHPDVFARGAPELEELDLIGNPLAVAEGRPILNHPTLLLLAVGGCNIPHLGAASLSGLPSLSGLYMKNCGLARVTAGAFSTNSIEVITLSDNPLEQFDVAAVRGATRVRAINIDNTTLACTCGYGYASLFWLTHALSAKCQSKHACSFTGWDNELKE